MPVAHETYALVIKNPANSEVFAWLAFTQPFSFNLWLVLGANVCICVIAVKALACYYNHLFKERAGTDEDEDEIGKTTLMMDCFQDICDVIGEENERISKKNTGRVFVTIVSTVGLKRRLRRFVWSTIKVSSTQRFSNTFFFQLPNF